MTQDVTHDAPPATGGVTRRRLAGLAGAATAAAALGAARPARADERPFAALRGPGALPRPNVLVIFADDLGYADLGSYGAPTARTPNLDRLARSGVRYTDAYSASAVCSPTRIAFFTGRHPARLAGGLPEPIGQANDTDGIPPGFPTMAELLRDQGYRTAMFGKWHGGFLPTFGPLKSGWDEFYGNYSGGVDYFSKLDPNGSYDLWDGEEPATDRRYYTHVIRDKAVEFLGRRHRTPWLLSVNVTSPHWPWEGPRDRAVSDELTARTEAGETGVLQHTDGGSLETYVEMVEDMDRSVGAVLDELRRTGQDKDTIVLFASDNGGERFSYNWPLTGEKVSTNEGGIRIPTILSWPGRIAPRQVDSTPVYTVDWTATFLELAGATADPDFPPDGVSLVDHVFRGRRLRKRDMFWRMRGGRALRRGDLKYVRGADGVDHLYDLAADVREQADLAEKRPDDLASLRSSWEAVDATLLPYAS